MKPHQKRVVDEKSELDKKLDALKAFIGTPFFHTLEAKDRDLLSEQLGHMERYSGVLQLRINHFQQ